MKNNKVITIAVAAFATVFLLSLALRFVFLSQYGFSGGWVYFGLPFGGIGILLLLLRLGVLNVGNGLSATYTTTPSVAASARLQELENIRAAGAISDSEYASKRQQILSAI